MKKYFFTVPLMFLLAGCQNYPQDPEGTLEKITNDTLRVGYSVNPPWITEASEGVGGIEVNLIKEFAAQHHAEVKWIKNTENELFQELIDRKLHVVISGLTTDSPWKKEKIGVTRIYLKTEDHAHIMAVPQGENAFLISLEKFLVNREKEINKAYEDSAPI